MKDVMRKLGVLLVVATLSCGWVLAEPLQLSDVAGTIAVGDYRLAAHSVGGLLPNAPNYDWWYGCSPTSSGMMMGHYDRNGYAAQTYTNLVPGGVAELNSYGNPTAIANATIASSGHIADFWVGYGLSAPLNPDPLGSGRAIPGGFNSLADFMGTSQDAAGNTDGSTTFYYWQTTGGVPLPNPFTADDAVFNGVTLSSGMYGVGEYVQYAGYNYVNPTYDPINWNNPQPPDDELYNQYIDTVAAGGFSLAQYQAEIDAGRPVLVHIENHTMLGYGYTAGTNIINVYDTWADLDVGGPWSDGQNPGTLAWGGQYDGHGMWHYGVTVLTLTGGSQDDVIPEPLSVTLLAFGALGLLRRRRKMAA